MMTNGEGAVVAVVFDVVVVVALCLMCCHDCGRSVSVAFSRTVGLGDPEWGNSSDVLGCHFWVLSCKDLHNDFIQNILLFHSRELSILC